MADASEVWTHWVDARRACAMLGVKRRTLYSYVSQGRIRSVAAPGGRDKRYALEDVMHLRDRARARRGHGPVAAAALDWGDPVLATAICAIDDDGPRYRGHSALQLARHDVPYEAVAGLLLDGELGAPQWTTRALPPMPWPRGGDPVDRFVARVAVWRTHPDAPRDLAGDLGPGVISPAVALFANEPGQVTRDGAMASRTLQALGVQPTEDAVRATDRALVLCAEHELNASSFAARIAASTGSDPLAIVLCALGAHAGAKHGAHSRRVDAMLRQSTPETASAAVAEHASRGGERSALPGFGHRLYAGGDPRGTALLREAERIAANHPSVRTARAVCDAALAGGYAPPNLDFGLTALAHALQLPPHGAQVLFTLGRLAGWLAHAREQSTDPRVLRPRARYTGP